MKYVDPKLPGKHFAGIRLSSWGLGNLLFPWGRAVVLAEQQGLQMVWPAWPQFHPGSWLRWELDKRTYHNLFQCSGDYAASLPVGLKTFSEAQLEDFLAYSGDAVLRVDQLMEGGFKPLLGHRELIWRQLCAMARDDLSAIRQSTAGRIAVHVRLGDMVRSKAGVTPVEWYRRRIEELRAAGAQQPVLVYSDDRGAALRPLWRMPDVERAPASPNALCDIAAMSGADLLIAGKGSTFSRWACFLSAMPVVSHSHDEWWRDAWKPYSRAAVGLVGKETMERSEWRRLLETSKS